MVFLLRMTGTARMLVAAETTAPRAPLLSPTRTSTPRTPPTILRPTIFVLLRQKTIVSCYHAKCSVLRISSRLTCRPEYHGYQGIFTFRWRWPIENLVAVTGTTESVSPLCTCHHTTSLNFVNSSIQREAVSETRRNKLRRTIITAYLNTHILRPAPISSLYVGSMEI